MTLKYCDTQAVNKNKLMMIQYGVVEENKKINE